MDVEAGDVVHERWRHDIDGNIRSRAKDIGERSVRGLREHDRTGLESVSSQEPPDNQATLGHEDPAALQQLRVRDVAVVGETRVGGAFDK